ncbi:MFS transporter [Alkalihalobacillus deserti]|uniref:MFS transporter n=1 Tax=Alkalihalobacillus deserti TaxID=2879466 RepID=UPI001D1422CA|nr:MFS transporter [Alkalihalobacillus deserti]
MVTTNAPAIEEFKNTSRLWQIGFFALNNTATNLYMFIMGFVSYYATGVAGLTVMIISTVLMAMRMFDGITDPIVGYFIDKTNSKLGKFRPFMIVGNIILAGSVLIIFNVTHMLPQEYQLLFFIFMYAIHMIGYTFQTACTRAAQTVLTNDPKQRPLFSGFDASYNIGIFIGGQVLVASYLVPKHGGFTYGFFVELNLYAVILSAIFTLMAVSAIWEKDRTKYFGFAEKTVKTKFKDYWPVIKRNRPLQMLVLAASTDKLASSVLRQPAVPVMFFGILLGDYALSGTISLITVVPTLLITFVGIAFARRTGLKNVFVLGTWGALLFFTLTLIMLFLIDPATISLSNLTFTTVLFLILYTLGYSFMGFTGNIVIPMIADTSDYETHVTGRYVPGMISTIFSFVDKMISSLAISLVGFLLATIGYIEEFPQVDELLTPSLFTMTLIMYFAIPMAGWVISLIAMKFYELDGKRMKQIQEEIAEVKQIYVSKDEMPSLTDDNK